MGQYPRKLILASGSPRRRELLEACGWQLEIQVPDADETWPSRPPEEAVLEVARRKLDAVPFADTLRLAADTVVILEGECLGKPLDAADAKRTLSRLSGSTHRVITGVCVGLGTRVQEKAVTTEVTFRRISAEEINWYVGTGEPMDKAGAYGIQGRGGAYVDRLRGSYTNVVGLPVAETLRAIDAIRAAPLGHGESDSGG